MSRLLRNGLPILLCIGFAMLASVRLWLTSGLPNGDDSLTHVFNLFALDRQIGRGDFYPLRFPDQGLGYGYAVLSYYPLLPYYLLESLRLAGVGYVLAFKLALTFITVLASLSSFCLGATLFGRRAGLITAFFYLFNPYFLANLYVRSALAEHVGLAISPLALLAIHEAVKNPGWRTYLAASLSAALLILAHFLTTLLLAPFAIGYALWTWASPTYGQRKGAVLVMAAGLTGAAMSCFYWLPAALERGGLRQIDQDAALAAYLDELFSLADLAKPTLTVAYANVHRMPELGLPILAAIGAALGGAIRWRRCFTPYQWRQWQFFLLAAIAAFWFSSQFAAPLWGQLPAIALIQFPFRWLGPAALFLSLAIGSAAAVVERSWLYTVCGGLLLGGVAYAGLARLPVGPVHLRSIGVNAVGNEHITLTGLRAFEYDQADSLRRACWVWAYEYVPSTSILSDCVAMRDMILDQPPVVSGLPPVAAHIEPQAITPDGLTARVSSVQGWQLSLHSFWLPGWQATVDGAPVEAKPVGSLGLAGLTVPAGEHEVQITYSLTPLRRWTLVVAGVAGAVWLALALRHWPLLAGVTAGVVLLLVGPPVLYTARAPEPPVKPADVVFGGAVALTGYGIAVDSAQLRLDLIWMARTQMVDSYKVFVHVIDDSGKLWSQNDSRPMQYASNTNRWQPGQVTLDRHELPLAANMPAGRYQVRVGLYEEENGQRLPVVDEDGVGKDDQVLLDYIVHPSK
jgi:hypothetical protein